MTKEMVILNRVGIILNFLAGFMLAPELIGLRRIKKFELYTERMMNSLFFSSSKFLKPRVPDYNQDFYDGFNALFWKWFFLVNGICALVLGLTIQHRDNPLARFLSILVVLFFLLQLLLLILILIFEGRYEIDFEIDGFHPIVQILLRGLGILLGFVFITMVANVFVLMNLILIPLRLFYTIGFYLSRNILIMLEGKDKLRSLIVLVGVLFFVLGNLFQFIATF